MGGRPARPATRRRRRRRSAASTKMPRVQGHMSIPVFESCDALLVETPSADRSALLQRRTWFTVPSSRATTAPLLRHRPVRASQATPLAGSRAQSAFHQETTPVVGGWAGMPLRLARAITLARLEASIRFVAARVFCPWRRDPQLTCIGATRWRIPGYGERHP